jgi:hypothetical protein
VSTPVAADQAVTTLPARGAGAGESLRSRSHPRLTRLGAATARIGLPAWFVALDLAFYAVPSILLVDGRLYQTATHVWLAGGDPWMVNQDGIHYAAGPWALLAYLPTAWLPLDVAAWAWAGAGLAAAVWTLRRLELPMWWLAFPPLAQALWNGNAQPIVLAALLVRAPWGVAIAGGLKLYGLAPAVVARRWREVAISAVVLAVTLPFLPWELWAQHQLGFHAGTTMTWNGSAFRFWPLIPVAIVALWTLRRRGAEWLTIPAIWPGTQHFYHVFALPALRDRPWLAAALALPLPLLAPLAIIAYAALEKDQGPVRRSPHIVTAP